MLKTENVIPIGPIEASGKDKNASLSSLWASVSAWVASMLMPSLFRGIAIPFSHFNLYPGQVKDGSMFALNISRAGQ